MDSYFLRNCFAQGFERVVNLVLYAFDEQPVAVRTVDVHKVPGLFQVNAAALVAMDHHYQGVDFVAFSGNLTFG